MVEKVTPADAAQSVGRIQELIATLRGKDGCPWDRKQTAKTMAAYVIEEAHELAAAVAEGDSNAICDELGDVLFQLLFIISVLEEDGRFSLSDVVDANVAKMIRRHPHVFGDSRADDPDAVRRQWYRIKAKERGDNTDASRLGDVPHSLPAMARAYRLSERAGRSGLDWPDLAGVMAKVREEWAEFEATLPPAAAPDPDAIAMEFGDLLFTMVNVSRFIHVHPESALAASTSKFERRFHRLESILADTGQDMADLTAEALDRLWNRVKSEENAN